MLEPSSRTWFGIRERIADRKRRLTGWVWAGATAAAAGLVIVAFYGRTGLGRDSRMPGLAPRAAVAATGLSPSREAAAAGLDLQYKAYLAGVDDAISEIERALVENPGNPRVLRAYQGAREARTRSFDRVVAEGN